MENEDGFYRKRGYRKKAKDTKNAVEFPQLTTISAKTIAYLHVHGGKQPSEIVAAYPTLVTLAQIHHALANYYENREMFEADFERGSSFLSKDALSDDSYSLPAIGLGSLVDIVCGDK
jgi:uncharacterized protein (DUF433 family)